MNPEGCSLSVLVKLCLLAYRILFLLDTVVGDVVKMLTGSVGRADSYRIAAADNRFVWIALIIVNLGGVDALLFIRAE